MLCTHSSLQDHDCKNIPVAGWYNNIILQDDIHIYGLCGQKVTVVERRTAQVHTPQVSHSTKDERASGTTAVQQQYERTSTGVRSVHASDLFTSKMGMTTGSSLRYESMGMTYFPRVSKRYYGVSYRPLVLYPLYFCALRRATR